MRDSLQSSVRAEIAVIGYEARLPGAENVDEVWRTLVESKCHVRPIPDSRWAAARFFDPNVDNPGQTYVRSAGLLENVYDFDATNSTLERQLASFVGTENAIVMVSGHATNVAAVRSLVGPGDVVLVDALAHSSTYEGIRASGAAHVSFPHNDFAWVDDYLSSNRAGYGNALNAIEGLYSMDGDAPDLHRFVETKHRHRCWLMVDEAHSMGVLGTTGRGICEEQGVDPRDVEIIIGTLSKSFCSCGGFVAGSEALTDLLRYKAPGFFYSVGVSTPNTAAAEAALIEIGTHPDYVLELREKSAEFRAIAHSMCLDTGESQSFAICPVIIGDSLRSVWISNQLLAAGYNVLPIIAPALPDRSARLRFFLNRDHDTSTMHAVLAKTAQLVEQSSSMTVKDLAEG